MPTYDSVNSEEMILEVSSLNIYVKKWIPPIEGSNAPIFLMHDSLGCIALWRDFPAQLAEKTNRTVIAYDRLGFGKSSCRTSLPSEKFIQEEAREIFPFLKKALQVTNFIVAGHSVGGCMAAQIAAHDKDCNGLITIAAQGFMEAKTIHGLKQAQLMFESTVHRQRLAKYHGVKADWILAAWFGTWLSTEFAHFSMKNCLQKVGCPSIAIHGESDEYGSLDSPKFIAEHVSGPSFYHILPNCGHVPHRECMDELILTIQTFIEQQNIY